MDEEVCFIDGDGNKISCEGICSHIGLARAILEKDKKLDEEFKKSGVYRVTFIVTTDGEADCECATKQFYIP